MLKLAIIQKFGYMAMIKPFAVAVTAMALFSVTVSAKERTFSASEVGLAPTNPLIGIKTYFSTRLKDPYSAEYVIDELYPAYCKNGWLQGGGLSWIGWAANIQINAKNSYGALTGYQPHTVMFTADTPVNDLDGSDFGAYGPAKGLLGLDGGAGVCKRISKKQISQ